MPPTDASTASALRRPARCFWTRCTLRSPIELLTEISAGSTKLEGGTFLILAVAHTAREDLESGDFVEIIRLISARRATSKERRLYGDENG